VYGKSTGQVVIRWHLQIAAIVIPKSSNPARIRQNHDVFDFELTDDDTAGQAAAHGAQFQAPSSDGFNVVPRVSICDGHGGIGTGPFDLRALSGSGP
jgi:diketogulonate reductase-like aldo/keto reductase